MSEQHSNQPADANFRQTGSIAPLVVPAGHGIGWFADAFALFKRSPGIWMLNSVIFFIVIILINMVPLLSIVASILLPVFVAGMILGCRDLDEGKELEVAHVFAGFQTRTAPLIALGAVNMLFSILMMIIMMVGVFGAGSMDMMHMDFTGVTDTASMAMMTLPYLIVMLLAIPIAMLFWFAPAIIVLNENIGVLQAMKLSFTGCLINMLPFLLYGLLGLLLMVAATIPLALGWLVLGPVLFGTIYVSYKDIYLK